MTVPELTASETAQIRQHTVDLVVTAWFTNKSVTPKTAVEVAEVFANFIINGKIADPIGTNDTTQES
ncbi:hypothetical protein [Nocardia sp. A7]|uniref:hypothetical protein n=1 Tax=Nocardia sp. A7 TaxID=2789274 RepID=UPI0039794426